MGTVARHLRPPEAASAAYQRASRMGSAAWAWVGRLRFEDVVTGADALGTAVLSLASRAGDRGVTLVAMRRATRRPVNRLSRWGLALVLLLAVVIGLSTWAGFSSDQGSSGWMTDPGSSGMALTQQTQGASPTSAAGTSSAPTSPSASVPASVPSPARPASSAAGGSGAPAR